jgi:REG-2-like HAD superfamily hydrolase
MSCGATELDCAAYPTRDRFAAHPDGARGWWGQLLERLCERLETRSAGPFAVAELFERFAGPDAWEIYPEVDEVLVELRRRGFSVGLISNWDERLPRLLDGLGLTARFDAVVFSQQVGVEKPHQRIFTAMLERLDLPPVRVLHVGDRPRHDVEGARAVGMRALLLDRSGITGDISNLAEIIPKIGPNQLP